MDQDNRIFSKTTRGCFQTKKLPAFVDFEGNIRSKRFEKHLKDCPHCRAAYNKYTSSICDINLSIPFQKLSDSQYQEIQSDVFAVYKVIQKERKKRSVSFDFSGVFQIFHAMKRQILTVPFAVIALCLAVFLVFNL